MSAHMATKTRSHIPVKPDNKKAAHGRFAEERHQAGMVLHG